MLGQLANQRNHAPCVNGRAIDNSAVQVIWCILTGESFVPLSPKTNYLSYLALFLRDRQRARNLVQLDTWTDQCQKTDGLGLLCFEAAHVLPTACAARFRTCCFECLHTVSMTMA